MNHVRLEEVSDTVMGQAPPGKACNKEGKGTPFVKAGEFSDRFPVIQEWTTEPLKHSKVGDVLICVVGATAGKINQGIDCAIGRSVAAIRPDARRLDTDFLYYFMRQKTEEMRAKSQGLAQGVITREMIAGIEIPLPPLEEQKRIAAILDQADELRRKRKRALDRLNQLGQSIFIEMFGDPTTNPMGWHVGTIRDLLDEAKYGTSAKANTDGVGLPILRMGNLTYDGKIDLSDLKYVELSDDEFEKYTTRPGDILFNRTNSKELVGKTAVITQEEPLAIAGYLVRARTNERGNPHYISAYLNSAHGKTTLRNMCKNIVGMANINAQEFQNISIAIPPREIQDDFAARLSNAETARLPMTISKIRTESLFTSLQARAFRGEL